MDHDQHTAHHEQENGQTHGGACCVNAKKPEYLLWGSVGIIVVAYALSLLFSQAVAMYPPISLFVESIVALFNQMAWGIIIGILFVGVLGNIPREFVLSLLGKGGTFSGIIRATGAGVLLDLCSHGILMVGAKLYERGASLGQVAAFLIASPWNSFSLTLILWALVGFKWMMLMLLCSMAIGVVSGMIFDRFVDRGVLPRNPNSFDMPPHFSFWQEATRGILSIRPTPKWVFAILVEGLKGSKMVLKWIFFGVILASLVRAFMPPEAFAMYFGPSIAGLALTVLVATILEVCSEGTLPIAADILTRAGAPGNAFAFLMTGVSTDYTEILILKEATKSWKIPLFLPLLTVPQVLLVAWLMNQAGSL